MERIFGLHQMNYSLQLITAPDSEGRWIILSAPSSRCSSRSRVNPPSSCSTGCVTTSQGHSFYSGSPLFSQVSLHLSAYWTTPIWPGIKAGCGQVFPVNTCHQLEAGVFALVVLNKDVGTPLILFLSSRRLAPVCNKSFAQPDLIQGCPANDCNWYTIKISHIQKAAVLQP